MSLTDLVVAVGADDQQPAEVGIGEERAQQREGRRIGPLEVIEEDHQGMSRGSEHRQELLKQQGEPVLRLRGPEDRHGGLLPDDVLDGRDDVDDDLRVDPERLEQRVLPSPHRLLALGQQLPHELLECLRQPAIGGVARQLVELPGDEVSAPVSERLMELVDQ